MVHCVTPLALLPALLARLLDRDLRVVVEFHAPAEFEMVDSSARARAFFRMVDRRVVRRADAVIVMSRSQREYLLDCGTPDAAIQVSWGPIDTGRGSPTPPAGERPLTFGYFGNAHFWQGLDVLLSTLRSWEGDPPKVVVGGVDPSELTGLPVPGLSLLGKLGRNEMLAAMATCDVLISPRKGGDVTSYQYPFKLSAYLGAGRPVIGTDVNDQGYIIDQAQCGIVIPPDDPGAMARAMREMSATPAAALQSMGGRARAFAEANLGYDRLWDILERAYGSRRPE